VRIVRRALTGLLAVGVLAGPGGGRPAVASDAAATVNGVAISVDDLTDTLEALGATGSVSGDDARSVLTQMISNEAVRQALEAAGVDPDSGAEADDPAAPAIVADRDRYVALLGETGAVDTEAVRDEYEQTGSAGGLLCLRLFVVTDVEAGEEAMDQLDDGAAFADVAVENDPTFATTGGSVTGDPNQLCFDPTGLTEAAAPIVDAVSEAGAEQPVGPIETEIATVIAIAPPFDEVSGELDDDLVGPVIADIVANADVSVAPRYGRWDSATSTVVPLGQP
jgi:hypothetical protein